MGRAKILCPHGVLGVARCKQCQREQHTERVRKLRERRKQLEDQEKALEKKWNRENVKVYLDDKATGVTDLKNPSVDPAQITAKHMAKSIQESTSQEKPSCATCVRQFPMDECSGLTLVERRRTAIKQGIESGCRHYKA